MPATDDVPMALESGVPLGPLGFPAPERAPVSERLPDGDEPDPGALEVIGWILDGVDLVGTVLSH